MRDTLSRYNWGAVLKAENNIDVKYNLFHEIITKLIEMCIPTRTITMRKTEPWFITPLIKSLLRKRNKLNRRGQVQLAADLSTKIGRLIMDVKRKTFNGIDRTDTRKIWQTINKKTNYRNKNAIQNFIKIDEQTCEDINKHFVNIATDEGYDIDEYKKIVDQLAAGCSIEETADIQEYEVYMLMSKLKKTSPGADMIPHWVFRECAAELSQIVAHLFNVSMHSGQMPSKWKHAIVTPVPKVKQVSEFTGLSDLRPISVTPILSRILEKIIVRKYLWPTLDDDLMDDQFAYRPTGSTTAALIQMLHYIYEKFESGNDYVRCLLIDYSKAFDTVNHSVLIKELSTLGLPRPIFKLIANFLEGRTQAVKIGTLMSTLLRITRSIVQGSGLGPYLYIALARRLKTISIINKLFKFADDTSLLVPQFTDCHMETEFGNVERWSNANKLILNTKKTKEIIFYKSKIAKSKHSNNINKLNNIDRIEQTTLLGIILNSDLSWSPQIKHVLSQITQRFYLLGQLKNMSMERSMLDQVFQALIISRIRYAIEAISGNLNTADIDQIDAMFRKARRWGIASVVHTYEEIAADADTNLVRKIGTNTKHVLYRTVPKVKCNERYELRNNNRSYNVSMAKNNKFRNSFIQRNFNK